MNLRWCIALVLWLSMGGCPVSAAGDLRAHPSPYLAMHAEDPVAWREWGPEVLAQARRENRLILVSVGYFACHWCHVMQRESWRDPQVGRLLNAAFIPVKVDREIAAALDARLQLFAERTRGFGGWPLNVFVTPEGYPLFALAYAPRDEFLRIAGALDERWRKEGPRLAALAREAARGPAASGKPPDWPTDFLDAARRQADPLRGGFGAGSKFPMVPQLMALLDWELRHPDAERRQWLLLTLEQMRDGGLRDHVAGGFFRYTVDPDWHEPHFEKMLYDNAQLALLYLRAGRGFARADLSRVGLETLDFMLAELATGGAFAASLSAVDGRGEEGGAYLWQSESLRRLLNAREWRAARRVWGLDGARTFAAGYLPLWRRTPSGEEAGVLAAALGKLRAARSGRLRAAAIPRDGKVLAGWNGLALQALSEASAQGPRYGDAARHLLETLRGRLWDGRRLLKGYVNDRRGGPRMLSEGELEDYAYLAQGAWRWWERSRDPAARDFALELARAAWRDFSTPGGLSLERGALLAGTAADAWEDGYGPAPAAVLAALSVQSGDAGLSELALRAIVRARSQAIDYPLGRASLAVLPTP